MNAAIVVAGGLNMDLVIRVSHVPRPGETILGEDLRTAPGGKGANQAYAAARLGSRVSMVGCVGDDAFGRELIRSLQSAGVDVRAVRTLAGTPTGIAMILVDRDGQNQIVVGSGANAQLDGGDVAAVLSKLQAGCLLLQLESPVDAVSSAAALAKRKGLTVILDPAPARPLSREFLDDVDILTPNQSEAMTLLGQDGRTFEIADAADVANAVRDVGVRTVVLKLGEHGAVVADGRTLVHHPAPRVTAVDTTAAGDTFNGALAAALSEGKDLHRAVDFANVAAALSVSRFGAQSSMPNRAEVEAADQSS